MHSFIHNEKLFFDIDGCGYKGSIYLLLEILSQKYIFSITKGFEIIEQANIEFEIDGKRLSLDFHSISGIVLVSMDLKSNEKAKEVADYLESKIRKINGK